MHARIITIPAGFIWILSRKQGTNPGAVEDRSEKRIRKVQSIKGG